MPRPARAAPPILYAVTNDGVRLPVVDVTHPAFAFATTDEELRALLEEFLEEQRAFARIPLPLRRLLLAWFLRGSRLGDGIRRAEGTFLTGMGTYLLKLPPEQLPPWATPVDRKIAAGVAAVAVRLRLADMAHLVADALAPALLAEPGRPLHLVNVAGGAALDSVNALLVLRRAHPDALAGRPVAIDVLDRDAAGPAFGERALLALAAAGRPLHGIDLAFRHVRYDWRRPQGLRAVLRPSRRAGALVACSSEGGLFEYGSDAEVVANLEAIRAEGPELTRVVGSVTRGDEPVRRLHQTGGAATYPRGLTAFGALAGSAGWSVSRAIERPFSDQVVLAPAAVG